MDLDAYVQTHHAQWDRLQELTVQRRLSGPECDELALRYEQVATHLSMVRTSAPDAQMVSHLSMLLLRARTRIEGSRSSTWRGVASFFTHRFPAALYRLRWWWLSVIAANVVVTAVMIVWLLQNPAMEQSLLAPEEIDQLVNSDIEGYYSEYASGEFAAQVWVNNAWVAALCMALGILGLPVIWLLFQNIANLAILGSLMHRADRGGHFWGLILPHGLLELTAVFVAAGAGLKLFWSWIEPGSLTRAQSLAKEGRTVATLALGLVVVLFISGLIEGFVTPSGLPTWARVSIGVLAELVFLLYVFVVGRAAFRAGHDGDVDDSLQGARTLTRA